MKKSISKILAITFSIAILFSSCSKAPNKILPKKDGLWSATYTVSTTVGSATSTQTGAWSVTFKKDGTGSVTDAGTISTFTWSYSKDSKTLTFNEAGSITPTVFTVEEMKSKSEKWTYQTTYTLSGIVYTISETITLTKV
ncbi:MAG: hypothetical protein WCI97_06540 [Bacteroidota bacterium]